MMPASLRDSSMRSTARPLAFLAALLLTLPAVAQEQDALPDIGSSANEMLSPAEERMYGEMTLRELRRYGLLLEDPLIESYLDTLGYRLAARSERPDQPYTFFMLRSRDINAFATLGGYIGLNSGMVLMAAREDEVAAVLAHEISHVTQRHVLRGAERAQKDAVPMMLGMLGAILAAQAANADADAVQAVVVGGMSLMQQRQINYTRSNEQEADRIGIQTLARAGYDPLAVADVFSRMERTLRGNQGGWQAPEYLRTHPMSTTRISEAKDRAAQMTSGGRVCVKAADGRAQACSETMVGPAGAPAPSTPLNPLLPSLAATRLDGPAPRVDTELFDYARERLRVLSAESWPAAIGEYQRLRDAAPDKFDDARRYGLAIAQSQAGQTAEAGKALEGLAAEHPGLYWIDLARAENEHRAGLHAASELRYENLLRNQPRNRPVILSYARALTERGSGTAGRKAQEVLRPLLSDSADDAAFQQTFARASELAGDIVRAGEAYAETAFLTGRPEDALNQLEALKQRDDVTYYQRARIDARIAAITPTVLELRRRGLHPEDMGEQLQPGLTFSLF
jgi:predicted Zn-dependent protease